MYSFRIENHKLGESTVITSPSGIETRYFGPVSGRELCEMHEAAANRRKKKSDTRISDLVKKFKKV